MADSRDERTRLDNLLDDRDGVTVLTLAALLAGLAVGWAARSLLAGAAVSDQFWLVVVLSSLAVALYSQASDGGARTS